MTPTLSSAIVALTDNILSAFFGLRDAAVVCRAGIDRSWKPSVVMFAGIQLFFLYSTLWRLLLPSLISKESPAGYKKTTMGMYSTSQFLSVAFGGTLGRFSVSASGTWVVFLAGAIIALAWWG